MAFRKPISLQPITPEEASKPKKRAKTKPAANKAQPPRPGKKQDSADIDRADSEGMAQAQDRKPKPTKKAKKGKR